MSVLAKKPSQRGRLAPSPTGAQHFGNARTYLLAWLSARKAGGQLVLRIEDIDSPRTKPGASELAMTDLHWLGIDWDEGPDKPGLLGPYFQTERMDRYHAGLRRLIEADRVYPCTCTRADIERSASAPHAGAEGPAYPGTCSQRSAVAVDALGDRPYCWRFRSAWRDANYADEFSFGDVVAGLCRPTPADSVGDFVVWKRESGPAYQLAVVVDDHAMGITEVVRGADLIPSTYRQLELYQFFGWSPPTFAHVPLVLGADGRRLAKRHGDTRLASLRAAGVPSEAVIGFLAWSAGLLSEPKPTATRDLLEAFSFAKIDTRPFVVTDAHQHALGYDPATASRFSIQESQ